MNYRIILAEDWQQKTACTVSQLLIITTVQSLKLKDYIFSFKVAFSFSFVKVSPASFSLLFNVG